MAALGARVEVRDHAGTHPPRPAPPRSVVRATDLLFLVHVFDKMQVKSQIDFLRVPAKRPHTL